MFYDLVYLYGEKTVFSLFPDGYFQVELHSDGNSALPAANDIQFQCHVCQRVTGVGMKIDNWQNASLNNWSIAGYFIGCIIAIAMGSKGIHLKYLFSMGFVLIGLSSLFMYFEVQTDGLYERMKYRLLFVLPE